jgi:hypothetical protein
MPNEMLEATIAPTIVFVSFAPGPRDLQDHHHHDHGTREQSTVGAGKARQGARSLILVVEAAALGAPTGGSAAHRAERLLRPETRTPDQRSAAGVRRSGSDPAQIRVQAPCRHSLSLVDQTDQLLAYLATGSLDEQGYADASAVAVFLARLRRRTPPRSRLDARRQLAAARQARRTRVAVERIVRGSAPLQICVQEAVS